MSGAKFGLEPGEVSVSFPVAALPDTRCRAPSALQPSRRRAGRPPSRPAAFGEDVTGLGTPNAAACHAAFLLPLSPRAQLPARCQERQEAERQKNFLLSTQLAVLAGLLGT